MQQALLKILEGTTASVPPQGGRKHPHQEFLTIDTTNILFVCGGSFAELDKVIERRVGDRGVGFGAAISSRENKDTGEWFEQVLPEDLIEYGLIPEFIGRLPVVAAIHQLSRDDLITILTEPRHALTRSSSASSSSTTSSWSSPRTASRRSPTRRWSARPAPAACARSSRRRCSTSSSSCPRAAT